MFGQRLIHASPQMADDEGRARSDSKDLLLLGVELLVGEQTLVTELVEFLQLGDVRGFVGLGWRSRCGLLRRHRLLLLHGLLLLVAAHAPGNCGGGSCHDGGGGRCTYEVHVRSSASRSRSESRHLSFLRWWS